MAEVAYSSVDKKSIDGERPVALCNYTDVFYNRLILPDMDLMRATASPAECDKWALRRGDVFFTKDSETRDEIGIPAYVPEDMPNVLCGYHLGRARPDSRAVDGSFLARALGSHESARAFARIANGITRFGLTLDAARSLPLLLPPLEEQRAIAAILDSIDEAIERTEEVIAATERLRDALLHDLLTRGLPGRHTEYKQVRGLGTIPACWRKVRLGELGRFINGRAFKPSDWEEVGLPIIRIQNLTNFDAPFNCYQGAVSENHFIDDGDIVVSWSASIEVRTWNRGPAVLNQHIFKVSEFPEVTDKRFLFYLLEATTSELRRRVHGTTMRHVTKGTFDSTPCALPPLEEQREIAAILDSIDQTLEWNTDNRDMLEASKFSTADALLTGRLKLTNQKG